MGDLKKLNAMIRQVQAKQKQEEEEKAEQFAKGWKGGWKELLTNNVAWTLKNGTCKRGFYVNKSDQPQGTSSKWLPPLPSQKGARRGRQRVHKDDEKLDERKPNPTKQSRPRSRSIGENYPERPWQSSKSATEYTWIPDNETRQCMVDGCRRPFSTFCRRHHCRACGLVI